jgi:pilus assembly protein Flp/PilA
MVRLTAFVTQVLKDEEGASVVEYGMLIGLLAVVAITSVVLVGHHVHGAFERLKLDMVASGR